MNKRITSLTVLAAMTVSSMWARQLTAEQAAGNLPADLTPRTTRGVATPLFIQKSVGINVAYVFNLRDNGFVVAAADDVLPAVLGYSESGVFDPDNIPPSLVYWLENYGDELEWALEHGQKAPEKAPTFGLQNVAAICTTTWNQDAPYNDDCPSVEGAHTPTGCTATAVAQVVAHHKYPERGWGSNTYTTGSRRFNLTFDFGSTVFDWDNMLDSYSHGYTADEAAAVAKLMEGVGNLSLMDYNKDASGAWPYNSLWGLVNYMGYDRSAYKADRKFYPIEEWTRLLHGELTEGRPVVYSGGNASAGHCFVVDGYREGFFHLNWGWGGMSDGYFLITALDPGSQGIGGSAAGYNSGQDALIGVTPSRGDSPLTTIMYAEGTLAAGKVSYGRDEWVELKMLSGNFHGFTLEDVDITLGFNLTPAEGGETAFYPGANYFFKSCYGSAFPPTFPNIFVDASILPTEGKYYVTPAYMYEGKVHDARFMVGKSSSMLMTCSADGVTLKDITPERQMTVEAMTVNDKVYVGKSCTIDAILSLTGDEYYGDIRACLYDSNGAMKGYLMTYDGSKYNVSTVLADVAEGREDNITLSGTFREGASAETPAGTYILSLTDAGGKRLAMAEPMEITIIQPATGACKYVATATVEGNYPGKGIQNNPYQIADDFKVNMKIDCTGGFFDGNIKFWGFYVNPDGSLDYNGPWINNSEHSFLVNAGETQDILYTLDTSNIEMNRLAAVWSYLYANEGCNAQSNYITNIIYVKRTSSGTDVIELPSGAISPNPADFYTTVFSENVIESVEIYSLAGTIEKTVNSNGVTTLAIELSDIPSGHHIVVVKTDNGTEIHRLIRR